MMKGQIARLRSFLHCAERMGLTSYDAIYKYCTADDLRCGNGTIRTEHPVELFGDDWIEWELGDPVAGSEMLIDGK